MKKIFIVLFFLCLSTLNSNAKIIETFCLINYFDLRENLTKEDQNRFAGKEIHLVLNFEDDSIMDISEDTEVSLITGMYGPQDKKKFIKNNNRIGYKNKIEVTDDQGGLLTYSYDNQVILSEEKPSKLLVFLNQTGSSLNAWRFEIDCRDLKYSAIEKNKAAKGSDKIEDLNNIIKNDKEKKWAAERKKNEPIIMHINYYEVNNYDDLLYLYKAKLFDNKINLGLELSSGDIIYFESVIEMNETEFFKLPLKGKGQNLKKRKLKKEFLQKKKNI